MTVHDVEQHIVHALEHFRHELSSVRTGRATPSLIETIKAEYYGAQTELRELGSIQAPEPMMLVMQVWDATAVGAIEKALRQSSLSINPAVEGQTIRIPFPSLTTERREELAKLVKQKAEEAKIRIRSIREDVLKKIRQQEHEGALSEDQAEAERKELQKHIDAAVQNIREDDERKQSEIMTI